MLQKKENILQLKVQLKDFKPSSDEDLPKINIEE